MADPQDVAGWLRLSKQHEEAASLLKESKFAAAQSQFHTGLAVECALKAYIMWTLKVNTWPISFIPNLNTHKLRDLQRAAGIALDPSSPVAPSWHIVLQWDRNQSYDPKPMPRKVARSFYGAAFGTDGVVTWIRQKLK